jgi:hypothetical protein
VTVTSETVLLQARSAQVAGVVEGRRVSELPLNGRNFARLTLTTPGVAGGDLSNLSVSGGRAATNSYVVDGIGASDERTPGGITLGGGAASSSFGAAGGNVVSTEAIQEFTVITANADATFGRASGAQVNIITKSGTNQRRGSAYGYGRHNRFDARDFFDTTGRPPPFRQGLFGATGGGPLSRDRHFAFVSYEGLRQTRDATGTATIPNAALISQMAGDLRRFFQAYYVERGLVPATGNPAGQFRPRSRTTSRPCRWQQASSSGTRWCCSSRRVDLETGVDRA